MVDTPEVGADREFAAIQSVYSALEPLEPPSRQRVFEYIAARLEISAVRGAPSSSLAADGEKGEQPTLEEGSASEREFSTFAELYEAANPQSDKDRTLVAAYWIQLCEGKESFVSYSANKALKNLGHGLSNVTVAFNALRRPKPSLILQLRKAGKNRQGRKTYKITSAGVAAVKEMVNG